MNKKVLSAMVSVIMAASFGTAMADGIATWGFVQGAEKYPFFCIPVPIGAGPFTPIAEPTTETLVITDAQLPIGVEHECWVRAAKADGSEESPDSNHVMVTNPGPYQVIYTLTAPGGITIQLQQ